MIVEVCCDWLICASNQSEVKSLWAWCNIAILAYAEGIVTLGFSLVNHSPFILQCCAARTRNRRRGWLLIKSSIITVLILQTFPKKWPHAPTCLQFWRYPIVKSVPNRSFPPSTRNRNTIDLVLGDPAPPRSLAEVSASSTAFSAKAKDLTRASWSCWLSANT